MEGLVFGVKKHYPEVPVGWEPTPEEIAAECRAIQEEWTKRQRRKREAYGRCRWRVLVHRIPDYDHKTNREFDQ